MARIKGKHAMDRWWAVRALYICDVASPHSSKRPTVEETLFLIKSSTLPEARRKAEKVAKKEQSEYKNYLGGIVRWRLIQLLELQEVIAPRIGDRVEVYFSFIGILNLIGLLNGSDIAVALSCIQNCRGIDGSVVFRRRHKR